MYYYEDGRFAALEPLPLAASEPGSNPVFLFRGNVAERRSSFRVTEAAQLTAPEGLNWLDPGRMPAAPALPPELRAAIDEGRLRAVCFDHPRFRELAAAEPPRRKFRVHILALGDVGSTILMGLKLLGGDCIEALGICDINEKALARWEFEMNQVAWPWDYDALPPVEIVAPEDLFRCDCFLFAASKGIPPVGSGVKDVRMAQFEANRGLVEHYARQARRDGFRGLFAVISDPVDPLAKAAFLASNRGEDGNFDGLGLAAEQVQGYGLGVMNARAAYYAKKDDRFADFLTEGRAFGPHGSGLVIANSIAHYDDSRSRELTELALTANLKMRELGFKPYAAPALSSAALSVLLTLRGAWHYGSVCLGGVWLGCKNRLTPWGVETERLSLPDPLYARLEDAVTGLRAIL